MIGGALLFIIGAFCLAIALFGSITVTINSRQSTIGALVSRLVIVGFGLLYLAGAIEAFQAFAG